VKLAVGDALAVTIVEEVRLAPVLSGAGVAVLPAVDVLVCPDANAVAEFSSLPFVVSVVEVCILRRGGYRLLFGPVHGEIERRGGRCGGSDASF